MTADANMGAVIGSAQGGNIIGDESAPNALGVRYPNPEGAVDQLNAAAQAASDLAVLTAMKAFSGRMVANIKNASS